MHFVTGGAFNGKRKWVMDWYGLKNRAYQWHSFYETKDVPVLTEKMVVLEGVEQFAKILLEKKGTPDQARSVFKEYLIHWQSEDRAIVLIGTDITKGIVPMDPFDRHWRDTAGWCFQEAAAAADRVDIVWYGLAETIKGEQK